MRINLTCVNNSLYLNWKEESGIFESWHLIQNATSRQNLGFLGIFFNFKVNKLRDVSF